MSTGNVGGPGNKPVVIHDPIPQYVDKQQNGEGLQGRNVATKDSSEYSSQRASVLKDKTSNISTENSSKQEVFLNHATKVKSTTLPSDSETKSVNSKSKTSTTSNEGNAGVVEDLNELKSRLETGTTLSELQSGKLYPLLEKLFNQGAPLDFKTFCQLEGGSALLLNVLEQDVTILKPSMKATPSTGNQPKILQELTFQYKINVIVKACVKENNFSVLAQISNHYPDSFANALKKENSVIAFISKELGNVAKQENAIKMLISILDKTYLSQNNITKLFSLLPNLSQDQFNNIIHSCCQKNVTEGARRLVQAMAVMSPLKTLKALTQSYNSNKMEHADTSQSSVSSDKPAINALRHLANFIAPNIGNVIKNLQPEAQIDFMSDFVKFHNKILDAK